MRTFWHIPYSPWSLKARWALKHHQVAHRGRSYRVGIDEMALRARLRRVRGMVTVPVLFDGDKAIADSFAIAQYADAIGNGTPLLAALEECRRWNERSDVLLSIGRRRALRDTLASPDAQREALRGVVPEAMVPVMLPVARRLMRRMVEKYPVEDEGQIAAALDDLRAALDGGNYLLGEFSYADIAMAMVFEFIAPLPARARGPVTQGIWGAPSLAERFSDLVEWRDRLVAEHRPD